MLQQHSPVELVQAGDLEAIAALLRQRFNTAGIHVKVARKQNCLGILLEADQTPDAHTVIGWIQDCLTALPEDIRAVKVYGQQRGQAAPAWKQDIQLAAPTSLQNWLHQGQGRTTPSWLTSDDVPKTTPELSSQQVPEAEKFLRFYFNRDETALLPVNCIKEVLKVPVAAILPVPSMPDCILGIYNCRGEILWLVDLGLQLGLGETHPITLNASRIFYTIVIEAEHTLLGIVVPQIMDIEQHSLSQMQPASVELFSPRLMPFIQGYLTRSSSLVLDVNALIQDPCLHRYRFRDATGDRH
ncbi:MAG: purine-binding chemotaxis protein CheW [Synechococcales cyanobacterium M58_A2018_015]|nr:purine-binding chemotaxis protein CheW [Synechococcales cyanobacterium M58_A2018_015]